MRIVPLVLIFVVACARPARQENVAPRAEDLAAQTIKAGDMYARIAFLASDALRGRDTPSPGLEAAAAYISSEFARLGLEPRGDQGGWLQRYPFAVRTLIGDSTKLTITTRTESATFAFGTDFFVMAGRPAHAGGELAFLGTRMPEAGAALAALKDRIAMIYVGGALDRAWRTAVNNARNATRLAGATALIVILDPSVSREDVAQRTAMFSTTRSVVPAAAAVFLRYDGARAAFRSAGHDLDALVARAKAGPIEPLVLAQTTAEVSAPVVEVVHQPPNVVAVLPGSDPELRNTYVVLSAHMDHIGVGRPNARGDSINNGADDDASGTSAVLEVAEALASLPQRPARSVLFLLVSGEEKGLLGSQYFADHPTVPLTSIVANINLDMIGRNAPDSVVAIGQDYSSLGPLTQDIVRRHPELNLVASRDLWPRERFFFRSDHYNFAKKDIPAIFFFSGVHEDYHQASDEVQKIDTDKAARVARLAYYVAHEVATRRDPPRWTEAGLEEVRSLTR